MEPAYSTGLLRLSQLGRMLTDCRRGVLAIARLVAVRAGVRDYEYSKI